MFGDLDKMLGNWKNKCLEKLEQKFGVKFPQLFTGGISRERKMIPDIPISLRNLKKNNNFPLWFPFKVDFNWSYCLSKLLEP